MPVCSSSYRTEVQRRLHYPARHLAHLGCGHPDHHMPMPPHVPAFTGPMERAALCRSLYYSDYLVIVYVWLMFTNSFSNAPSLWVSIRIITGYCINFITLLIDHEWSMPSVLSRKVSFLVSSSLGHSFIRWINDSSPCAHSLQYFEISKLILLWWYARKFGPRLVLTY